MSNAFDSTPASPPPNVYRELADLRAALRSAALLIDEPGWTLCSLCHRRWRKEAPEAHEPSCALSPRPLPPAVGGSPSQPARTTADVLASLLPAAFGVIAHGDRLIVPCETPEGPASLEVETYINGGQHLRCNEASVVKALRVLGKDDVDYILGAHDRGADLRWDEDGVYAVFDPRVDWLAAWLTFRSGVLALLWSASQVEIERAGQAHRDAAPGFARRSTEIEVIR